MKEDTKKLVGQLFADIDDPMVSTDPEFAEIIANFSQGEAEEANVLTKREQMLCILSALLGCQRMGESMRR